MREGDWRAWMNGGRVTSDLLNNSPEVGTGVAAAPRPQTGEGRGPNVGSLSDP